MAYKLRPLVCKNTKCNKLFKGAKHHGKIPQYCSHACANICLAILRKDKQPEINLRIKAGLESSSKVSLIKQENKLTTITKICACCSIKFVVKFGRRTAIYCTAKCQRSKKNGKTPTQKYAHRKELAFSIVGKCCVVCGTDKRLSLVDKKKDNRFDFSNAWGWNEKRFIKALETVEPVCRSCQNNRMRQPTHGTIYMAQKKKCKCSVCVDFYEEYTADYNLRRREDRNRIKQGLDPETLEPLAADDPRRK